jgi:phage tail-like protein
MVFELEITDPDGSRRQVALGDTTSIGRQPGNDLVFDDARVSRQHAVIECHDDLCWITDLGSSNGTLLDGERLPPNAPTPLAPGLDVTIGEWRLALVVSDALPHPAPADRRVPTLEEEPEPAPEPVEEEPPAPIEDTQHRGHIPPPPPGEGGAGLPAPGGGDDGFYPPGLGYHSRSLLGYLPGIYHTDFMSRFLALFESILTPIEWNIDNFDLFLDPGTAPSDFLSWLAEWFDITFDPSWSEVQRRRLLREAHIIYARRGTRWALSRVLEIYTGSLPTITDVDAALEPFTFKVSLPMSTARLGRDMIEHLIDAHKPTHTMYTLEFN